MWTYKIYDYKGNELKQIEADNFRYQQTDRKCNVVEFFKYDGGSSKETIAVVNLRNAWFERT